MDFNPPVTSTPVHVEIKRRAQPTLTGRRLELGPISESKEGVSECSIAGATSIFKLRSGASRKIPPLVVVDSSLDDSLELAEPQNEMPPKKAGVKEKPGPIEVVEESALDSSNEGDDTRKNGAPLTPPDDDGTRGRKRPVTEENDPDSPQPPEKKVGRGKAKVVEEESKTVQREEEKKLEEDTKSSQAMKRLLEEDNYLYSKPEEKKKKEDDTNNDQVLKEVLNDILEKPKGPGTRSRKKVIPTPVKEKEEDAPPKRGRGKKKAAPAVDEHEDEEEDEEAEAPKTVGRKRKAPHSEIHIDHDETAGYEEKVGKWLESQVEDDTELREDEEDLLEEDEEEEENPRAKRKAEPKKPMRRKKEVEMLMESQVWSEKPKSQRSLRSKEEDLKAAKSPKPAENGSVIDEVEDLLDSLDRVKCPKGEMEVCFGKNQMIYVTIFPSSTVQFYFNEEKEIKALKGQGKLFVDKKSVPITKKTSRKAPGECDGRIDNSNKRTPLIVCFSEPCGFNSK